MVIADLSFPAASMTSWTVKFPYSCNVHSSIVVGSERASSMDIRKNKEVVNVFSFHDFTVHDPIGSPYDTIIPAMHHALGRSPCAPDLSVQ